MKKRLLQFLTAGFMLFVTIPSVYACSIGGSSGGAYDLSTAEYKIRNESACLFDGEDKHIVIDFYEGDRLKFTVDTADYCSDHGGVYVQRGLRVSLSSDHRSAGTHSVTVEGVKAEKYLGAITIPFTIQPVASQIATLEELESALAVPYEDITVTADLTVPQDKTLLIPKDVTVDMQGYALTNEGELDIRGALSLGEGGKIFNHGTLSIDASYGSVTTAAESAFLYTNSALSASTTNLIAENITVYTRRAIGSVASPSYASHDYTGEALTPTPNFSIEGVPESDYTLSYENNVNVGTATITITTVNPESQYIYGEHSWTLLIRTPSPTVRTQTELDAYLADPNYTYLSLDGENFGNVVIPQGVTVALARNTTMQSLVLSGTLVFDERALTVTGNFENDGTLSTETPLTVGGQLINNGTLSLDAEATIGSVVNGGTLSVNEPTTITGNISNEGSLTVYKETSVGGNLFNDGTFSVHEQTLTTINGNLVNEDSFTLSRYSQLYTNGKVESDGNFHTGVYSSWFVGKGFVGTGFETRGYVYLHEGATVENTTGTLANYGKIYTNFPLNGVADRENGTTVVRPSITLDDFNAYQPIPYAEKFVAPDMAQILPSAKTEDYSLTYYTAAGVECTPKTAGNYIMRVTFTGVSRSFCGSVDLPYTIARSAITVTSSAGLSRALNDENYELVELTTSVTASSSLEVAKNDLHIKSGARLTINGHRFDIKNGRKVVNDGVFLNQYYYFTVGESVITHGENNENIDVTGGSFENNGECYLNDNDLSISGGTVYVRRPLSQANVSFYADPEFVRDTQYSFRYYADKNVGTFALLTMGNASLTQKYSDYHEGDYYFSDGHRPQGLGDFTATIKTTPDSRYAYGETTLAYTVVQSSITVSNSDDLLAALAAQTNGIGNYHTITLGKNVDTYLQWVKNFDKTQVTVSVGKHTVLDMNGYVWEQNRHENLTNLSTHYLHKQKLLLVNNGTIIGWELIDFDQYFEYAVGDTGSLEFTATTLEELKLFTTYGTKVTLNADITSTDILTLSARYGDCTLDLNGYTLTCPQLRIELYESHDSFTVQNGRITTDGTCCAVKNDPMILFFHEIGTTNRLHLQDLEVDGTVRDTTSSAEELKNYYTATNCTICSFDKCNNE